MDSHNAYLHKPCLMDSLSSWCILDDTQSLDSQDSRANTNRLDAYSELYTVRLHHMVMVGMVTLVVAQFVRLADSNELLVFPLIRQGRSKLDDVFQLYIMHPIHRRLGMDPCSDNQNKLDHIHNHR